MRDDELRKGILSAVGYQPSAKERAMASAAIAAVSARRMVSPREAAIQCELVKSCNSSSVQPPSGPMARVSDCAVVLARRMSERVRVCSVSASTMFESSRTLACRPSGTRLVLHSYPGLRPGLEMSFTPLRGSYVGNSSGRCYESRVVFVRPVIGIQHVLQFNWSGDFWWSGAARLF